MWPLLLALLVGVAVGGAATFLLVNRDHPGLALTGVEPELNTEAPAASAPAPPASTVPNATPAAPGGAAEAVPARPAPVAPPVVRSEPPIRSEPPAPRDRAPVPAAEPGRLLVRSTPAGARVFVDGRSVGATPVTLRDLDPGPHTVRIARDGYQDAERRVTITSTRPAPSVTVALARARAASERASLPVPSTPATVGRAGLLFVESRPVNATVYVDGKLVGTTPMQMDGVDAGPHVVRLELAGYNTWSSAVRVPAGERLRVSASLER